MSERFTLPTDLTEDEALDLARQLDQMFGWAGTFYTRSDAEAAADTTFTDEQWDRLRSSRMWQRSIADVMSEYAIEVVYDAIASALPELDGE